MEGEPLDAYLRFVPEVRCVRGFVVPRPDLGDEWSFGVGVPARGDALTVRVAGEGRAEFARHPDQVTWFNRAMREVGVGFVEQDGHYDSFISADRTLAPALQRALLHHGYLASSSVYGSRGDLAPSLLRHAPTRFSHEEYLLSLRTLPGEDPARVRYIQLTACGPHDDGRHGLKALVTRVRGGNRSAVWLDRQLSGRNAERLPTDARGVHRYAVDRETARTIWSRAAMLTGNDAGVDEKLVDAVEATWAFAPWSVTLRPAPP